MEGMRHWRIERGKESIGREEVKEAMKKRMSESDKEEKNEECNE